MAEITLLGIPYDASSSYVRGAAGGPAAIRRELARVAEFSNLMTESGIDLEAAELLRDAGDLAVGDASDTRAVVERSVSDTLLAGERPLLLGGDHSITYPALRGVHAVLGQVDVLHLDAHPDLYPEFQGDRFSHACPFARALEAGLIGRLVQVGIRAATPPQLAVAQRHGVEMLAMRDWGKPVGYFFDRPLYISLDIDVLDPAFAPGVAHPEPGGLTVREVLSLLQRVHGKVVGADLVEYNPDADRDGRTATVCVKLLKELAALLASS